MNWKLINIIVAVVCIVATVTVIAVAETKMVSRRYEKRHRAYYDEKVAGYRVENESIAKGGIVFVGDSITDICDLDKFYPGLNAVNRGISGDHTEGVLARMDSSVYDPEPSLVVLLIGVNDLTRDRTPDEIVKNIYTIVELVHEHCPDADIIVQSVYPFNDRWNKKQCEHHTPLIREINASLASSAERYDYTFANVYEALDDGTSHMPESYTYDGLHPSEAGYEVISAYLRPIIDEVLASRIA